jgi:hypothetical protein
MADMPEMQEHFPARHLPAASKSGENRSPKMDGGHAGNAGAFF